MPRLAPQHWKTLKKVLESAGFREERRSGDHICMVKAGTDRPVVIPMYRAIGPDIIHANLRTAHLSREAYLRLLSKV